MYKNVQFTLLKAQVPLWCVSVPMGKTKDRNTKYRGILKRDELSFREIKAEPARVMEPELLHLFRMRARVSGFAGFEDFKSSERGMVLA